MKGGHVLVMAMAFGLTWLGAGEAAIVDEPLGARYSLGLTLWHLGHQPQRIEEFHQFLERHKVKPEQLLPAASRKPPATLWQTLLQPERLPEELLNGWRVEKEWVISAATDAGPTMTIPLQVARPGLYRLWIRYYGRPGHRGVTFIKIYRAGREAAGPICQPDEFYDQPAEQEGPQWHDLLVDLPAGELRLQLGHVTRWWHGPGGYDLRRVDCVYLTEAIWEPAPTAEQLAELEAKGQPLTPWQFAAIETLTTEDKKQWLRWQIRPVFWEEQTTKPQLFAWSRRFWRQLVEELERKDYPETKEGIPDYRAPERQLIFDETWNMLANPVRIRRQIDVLEKDISRKPLPYHYVWLDVARSIPHLADEKRPAEYGDWRLAENCLFASYGSPQGRVATEFVLPAPGRYSLWVLSSYVNLSYTAPWIGIVSLEGQEQFRYHHAGKIPSLWMKMGEIDAPRGGRVRVEFVLDGAGAGGTYRRIYTLFAVDDPQLTPQGTIRPPWTMEMYAQRARQAGAKPGDQYLPWITRQPFLPLSQEVWADESTGSCSWPETPVKDNVLIQRLLLASGTRRAVQIGLRNLTERPLALQVRIEGPAAKALSWRVVAFAPYGPDRQQWTPFFLLRRPNITIPPLNIAGLWLTIDSAGLKPGEYSAQLRLTGASPERIVRLVWRVSPVRAKPKRAVWIDGYTQPPEGEAYVRDFVAHGMNVWRGWMSKVEMEKYGIVQIGVRPGRPEDLAPAKKLGLDYEDWFAFLYDEPCGKTEEELKPFLELARAIKQWDPRVRISFNPGEAAGLETFQILDPFCDLWIPYSLHLSPHWRGPEKWAIYKAKPWLWYTTPCLWDKSPALPQQIFGQIRQIPAQTGYCVGTAFFALYYPFRDPWDTAYEHIPDVSVMGALPSRHGPVPTRTWEAIGEAAQEANLAMLVRERLGVERFEQISDDALKKLIAEGSSEALIRWLEAHP